MPKLLIEKLKKRLRAYVCDYCGKKFKQGYSFQQTIPFKSPKILVCKSCKKRLEEVG